MKKLNNKGMTITELLIGFVIVMVIFISLFSIVSTYRERLQIEGYRNELITFQATLYKAIYDDINNVSNPLSEVEETNCQINDLNRTDCIVFSYQNTESIYLYVDRGDKIIYYNDLIYEIPDKAYIAFVPVDEAGNDFVFTHNLINDKNLFTIDFEIEHLEVNDVDFGLHIVGTY